MESDATRAGVLYFARVLQALKEWGKLVEVRDKRGAFHIFCGKLMLKVESVVESLRAGSARGLAKESWAAAQTRCKALPCKSAIFVKIE